MVRSWRAVTRGTVDEIGSEHLEQRNEWLEGIGLHGPIPAFRRFAYPEVWDFPRREQRVHASLGDVLGGVLDASSSHSK